DERLVQSVVRNYLIDHGGRRRPASQVARHRLHRDGGEEQEERTGRHQPEHQDAGDDPPDQKTHHVHEVTSPPAFVIGRSVTWPSCWPTKMAWSRLSWTRLLRRPRLRVALLPAKIRSVLGSMASLMPSPSRLNASVVTSSASAGNTMYHQATW